VNIKDLRMEDVKEFLYDPQKRAYFILAAAALFFLIILFWAVIPGAGIVITRIATQSNLEKTIDLAEKDIAKLPIVRDKLAGLKEEYGFYSIKIPSRKEIGEFLESLAVTAGRSDVRLLSVTPLDQTAVTTFKPVEKYSDMMLIISAKGGYHQINRFVEYLESGRGFSSIRDIRIQNDTKNPTRHDAHIVLKVYVFDGDSLDEKK